MDVDKIDIHPVVHEIQGMVRFEAEELEQRLGLMAVHEQAAAAAVVVVVAAVEEDIEDMELKMTEVPAVGVGEKRELDMMVVAEEQGKTLHSEGSLKCSVDHQVLKLVETNGVQGGYHLAPRMLTNQSRVEIAVEKVVPDRKVHVDAAENREHRPPGLKVLDVEVVEMVQMQMASGAWYGPETLQGMVAGLLEQHLRADRGKAWGWSRVLDRVSE